jgi:DNA helicase II / ATP-dependent DNA helicase PcrA
VAPGGMIELTGEQRAAVANPSNLLLTACPGGGKTRTLITKLVAEIEGVRGSPRAICCITYTNTAVQEIEQRAREQLQPGDEAYFSVSTIHAFCLNEVLRPYGWLKPELAGPRKILTRESPDFETICAHAAAQVNLFQLSHADYEAFESLSVDAQGRVIGLAARNDAVRRAAPHFWARCAELGYIDFGTIIFGVYRLLRDHPCIAMTLCARFRWFLVDEFQDTTELQIEILKLLHATGRSAFFAVGDLMQSIFSFTGAWPELVAPFAAHIDARTDLSLSENFRSSRHIVDHAERLFPRVPAMIAVGRNRDCPLQPILVRAVSVFQAITEEFLPRVEAARIPLGDATVLAKDWSSLIGLSRQLREFGTPIVGPGARPYRRSRLFAQLAEQFCGALTEPNPETSNQLERALFHAVQDVTGHGRLDVFSHEGRVVLVRLMREAARLAAVAPGAVAWLDAMSQATGTILKDAGYIDQEQAGLFFASVQEMKADMRRQNVDIANLSIEDLGLFASPTRALRLSTIHYAKGREYDAVAMIGLRRGAFPPYRATDIDAEKRLFYVGVTRARRLLMYVAERDSYGNPPSMFLGPNGVNIL